MRQPFEDLTGREFGKLKVTSLHSCGPRANWNCVCECGKEKVVWAWDIQSGKTRSCGCVSKARKRIAKRCVFIFIAFWAVWHLNLLLESHITAVAA